jgi:outer membrane protein OmpA-like peptidoglycan-associated protein
MADDKHGHEQLDSGGGGHGRGAHAGAHGGGHEEAHEGAPEWLISFADNVMLQMGFFVILLGLAMQASVGGTANRAGEGERGRHAGQGPTAEALDWAIAVREAFNNPVDLNSTDPRDALLIQRKLVRMGKADANAVGRSGSEHDVKSIRPSDYTGLGASVPFALDATQLDDEGRAAVAELLEHLRGHRNILEIRGHVSAAEAFHESDHGIGFSYRRAQAVAKALAAGGINWGQMRLIACGDTDRLVREHADAPGQRENQRVEIIITDEAQVDGG